MSNALFERYQKALRNGHVAAASGRLGDAMGAYREAIGLAGDRPVPYTALADVLFRLGDAERSLETCDEALELDPENEAALLGRARALEALDRTDEAAETYDRLADARGIAGRLAEACDAVRLAMEHRSTPARRHRLQDLTRTLRLAGGDPETERTLGRALGLAHAGLDAAETPLSPREAARLAAAEAAEAAAAEEAAAAVEAVAAEEAAAAEAAAALSAALAAGTAPAVAMGTSPGPAGPPAERVHDGRRVEPAAERAGNDRPVEPAAESVAPAPAEQDALPATPSGVEIGSSVDRWPANDISWWPAEDLAAAGSRGRAEFAGRPDPAWPDAEVGLYRDWEPLDESAAATVADEADAGQLAREGSAIALPDLEAEPGEEAESDTEAAAGEAVDEADAGQLAQEGSAVASPDLEADQPEPDEAAAAGEAARDEAVPGEAPEEAERPEEATAEAELLAQDAVDAAEADAGQLADDAGGRPTRRAGRPPRPTNWPMQPTARRGTNWPMQPTARRGRRTSRPPRPKGQARCRPTTRTRRPTRLRRSAHQASRPTRRNHSPRRTRLAPGSSPAAGDEVAAEETEPAAAAPDASTDGADQPVDPALDEPVAEPAAAAPDIPPSAEAPPPAAAVPPQPATATRTGPAAGLIPTTPRRPPRPPVPDVEPEALVIAAEESAARGDVGSAVVAAMLAARVFSARDAGNAALDVCTSALAIAPAHVDLHLLIAELYVARGWDQLAADTYQGLLRLARLDEDTVAPRASSRPPRPTSPETPASRRERVTERAGALPLRCRRTRPAGVPPGRAAPAGEAGGRCYTLSTMPQLLDTIAGQISPTTLVDIGITALVIYWLFSLIRGTRAVRLVIGVSVILVIYAIAQAVGLRLFTQLMQAGAVVGLFALVVVFQPELRRGLDRIGRVGSFAWLQSPADQREADHVAAVVARAAARLSSARYGALIVIERETGLEEIAETGVMIHGDLSSRPARGDVHPAGRPARRRRDHPRRRDPGRRRGPARSPRSALQAERFGTRHRAALGITEATDAIVVVVSEETGQASLVERARIRRNLDEGQLAREISALLVPGRSGRAAIRDRLTAARPRVTPLPGALRRAALGDLRRLAQRGDDQVSPVTAVPSVRGTSVTSVTSVPSAAPSASEPDVPAAASSGQRR